MDERVFERLSLDSVGKNAQDSHQPGLVLGLGGLESVVHGQNGGNRVFFDKVLKDGRRKRNKKIKKIINNPLCFEDLLERRLAAAPSAQ